MSLRDGGPLFWNKFTYAVLYYMEESEWKRVKERERWRVRSVALKLFTHTIELFSLIVIRILQALLAIPATLGRALFTCTQIAWCLLCGYFLYLLFFHGACRHATMEFGECRREMPITRNFHSVNEGVDYLFQTLVEHLQWHDSERIGLCNSNSEDPISVFIHFSLESFKAPFRAWMALLDAMTGPIPYPTKRKDDDDRTFGDAFRSFGNCVIECFIRFFKLLEAFVLTFTPFFSK